MMIPIAHRGFWWPDAEKGNTIEAAKAAGERGFGVELDVCQLGDSCYIQHSPQVKPPLVYGPRSYLAHIPPTTPLILWNVKTEGLEQFAINYLGPDLHKSWMFDQDLIDPEYGKRMVDSEARVRVMIRASDKPGESLDKALNTWWARGIWLDCFSADNWITSDVIQMVQCEGFCAFVVSPELHGHVLDLKLWEEWQQAEGICTDVPHLLADFATADERIFPKEKWWNG